MRAPGRIVRASLMTAVIVAGSALAAGTAVAEGNGGNVSNYDVMRTKAYTYDNATGQSNPSTCSSIKWKAVKSDSPIDNNSRALAVNVCAGTSTGNDYALAYTRHSLNIDQNVGDVQNLSYDFKTDLVGAGAPRISVQFNNGDVAYLTASTCKNPIAVSGGSWSRADFTGARNNCSFDVTGITGGTYTADGTSSAWDVYAAAHPDQFVNQAYLVFDEAGKYRLDRIALGTDLLYNYSSTRAFACLGSENRC